MAAGGWRVHLGRGSCRRAGRRGRWGGPIIREAPPRSSCGGGQRGSDPSPPPRELGPDPDNRTGNRAGSARSVVAQGAVLVPGSLPEVDQGSRWNPSSPPISPGFP
jgi:hypothetical protein